MKFKLSQVDHVSVIKKALLTFLGAFVGVFVAGLTNLLSSFQNGGLSALRSAALAVLIAAIGGGITTIWEVYFQAKV